MTTYTYDELDRLVSTALPDGTTTSQTYDAENHRLSSTDAAGNTTRYTYDAVGRLTRTTFADGTSRSTAYDSAGRAVQTADERGYVTWTAYDAAGRVTSTTDATGAVTRHEYDAAGNQTRAIDALGHTTSFAYDGDNRVVATTYADGTADASLYDSAGRMVTKVDTLGRSTHYASDGLGQLVQITDALGNVTRYTYDEVGSKTSIVDANGHTTTFGYDFTTGAQTSRGLPDGNREVKVLDAAGQVMQHFDFAGRKTTFTRDVMGRVLTRTYPDGTSVAFTYTPTGQRATMSDARGTTAYAYDVRNRLVRLTYPDGRQLTYGYDALGERTSVTAKIGTQALTTSAAYDAAGRVSAVTDPLGRTYSAQYDADGERTQLAYPNTAATSYAYDANHRVTNIATTQAPGGGGAPLTLASFAYTLDLAGKRTRVVEADGTVRKYGYDSIDRLTNEVVTGALSYAKAFTYDSVGNRLTQTTTGAGASNISYAYDARDQLTSETSASYTYDANGNVLSKSDEASYAWDFENRLTQVTLENNTVETHSYDADGNRVQTASTDTAGPPITTNYLVDTSGGLSQVVAETDANGNLTAHYVRAGDQLLAVMRPGGSGGMWTTHFVHADGLGSVRAISDETGAVIDTRGYEAFGTKSVEAGSEALAYGFAAEPLDSTSHLAYHRARWMDARLGRFLALDPLPPSAQPNGKYHAYRYASNNPLVIRDPSGKFDLVDIAVVTVVSGLLTASLATAYGAAVDVPSVGVEITVIDSRFDPSTWAAYTGPASAWTRFGAVEMTDTSSMVTNVLTLAGSMKIARLNILDHGNAMGFELGNDFVDATSIGTFIPTLSRLKGHFTSNGYIHLQHCDVGQAEGLLMQLSDAIDVPVWAGTGVQNPVLRFNFDEYVLCTSRLCLENVGRPGNY